MSHPVDRRRLDPSRLDPRRLGAGLRAGALVAVAVLLGCPSGSSSRSRPRPPDITVAVDLGTEIGDVSPLLFGITAGWEDLASGILQGGEMARDRSFRLQGTPEEVWLEIPGAGTIAREPILGDATPTGHPGYPGSLRLASPTTGQVAVAQVLLSGLQSGVDYTLALSSFAESPSAPTLTARSA